MIWWCGSAAMHAGHEESGGGGGEGKLRAWLGRACLIACSRIPRQTCRVFVDSACMAWPVYFPIRFGWARPASLVRALTRGCEL